MYFDTLYAMQLPHPTISGTSLKWMSAVRILQKQQTHPTLARNLFQRLVGCCKWGWRRFRGRSCRPCWPPGYVIIYANITHISHSQINNNSNHHEHYEYINDNSNNDNDLAVFDHEHILGLALALGLAVALGLGEEHILRVGGLINNIHNVCLYYSL